MDDLHLSQANLRCEKIGHAFVVQLRRSHYAFFFAGLMATSMPLWEPEYKRFRESSRIRPCVNERKIIIIQRVTNFPLVHPHDRLQDFRPQFIVTPTSREYNLLGEKGQKAELIVPVMPHFWI